MAGRSGTENRGTVILLNGVQSQSASWHSILQPLHTTMHQTPEAPDIDAPDGGRLKLSTQDTIAGGISSTKSAARPPRSRSLPSIVSPDPPENA
ncbi:uncharacterized protein APUU_21892S [Aspergillus puulaauensis]|uniref:Uncharacterized protein n=1 Tax=Aspergillus puulaauensis TaxID=1220207 RepID=A0A7R8ALA2_9EURO|nr:uncharacterized protein APUU_21892S [Aspergillus puulaauensis]BCS21460.1 hypothetical protein APUU_21892S [Aspergillus puulaauensis]